MGSQKRQKSKEGSGAEVRSFSTHEAVPAIVEEIIGRTGFRGELCQVRVKIIDGPESGKTMRRNVKGPIKVKDILMLRETEIEARKIRSRVMKGAFT